MREVLAKIWASGTGRIGLLMVLLVLAAAILAPLLSGFDPNKINVVQRFASPSAQHWMGTDQLGRDFLARLLYGTRIAILVAVTVVLLAALIGTLLGIAAAYAPGRIEQVILIFFDILSAFPSLIFALALVAVLGPSLGNVIIIVTATLLPQFGRVSRAQVLALRQAPFLEAELVLGAGAGRIVLVHVLPNIMGPLFVLASMDVPVVITVEAALSFLGVGVRPPLASWGTLLHDGYEFLDRSIWPAIFSAGALTVATLGFTLFGEALRDAIDPKLKTDR